MTFLSWVHRRLPPLALSSLPTTLPLCCAAEMEGSGDMDHAAAATGPTTFWDSPNLKFLYQHHSLCQMDSQATGDC